MAKKLNHARHNKEACEHLRRNGSFNDWVVTTAFYSAIHYVDHLLFPNQYDDHDKGKPRQFGSFEELYRSYKKGGGECNKHSYRTQLVEEHCPEFVEDFQTLYDNCWTARYKDYRVEEEIADLCSDCLESIKDVCEPLPTG